VEGGQRGAGGGGGGGGGREGAVEVEERGGVHGEEQRRGGRRGKDVPGEGVARVGAGAHPVGAQVAPVPLRPSSRDLVHQLRLRRVVHGYRHGLPLLAISSLILAHWQLSLSLSLFSLSLNTECRGPGWPLIRGGRTRRERERGVVEIEREREGRVVERSLRY